MGRRTCTFEDRMFVRDYPGAPTGARVLWIHGLGESGLSFERVVERPELATFAHLVPDLPGYGRSPWPSEPASLEGVVDGLAGWLDAREVAPAVVVGHSLGGVLALLLAERHPAHVAAVVDVDGNKSVDDCVFSGVAARQEPDEFARGGFDELRDRVFRDGLDDEAHRGYFASLSLTDPRSFHLHARELVALSGGETLARRLAALTCPRHYLAGVPTGVSERSLRLLAEAGVPVTEISPSGHWPFIDRPAAFAAALRSLLVGDAPSG